VAETGWNGDEKHLTWMKWGALELWMEQKVDEKQLSETCGIMPQGGTREVAETGMKST